MLTAALAANRIGRRVYDLAGELVSLLANWVVIYAVGARRKLITHTKQTWQTVTINISPRRGGRASRATHRERRARIDWSGPDLAGH